MEDNQIKRCSKYKCIHWLTLVRDPETKILYSTILVDICTRICYKKLSIFKPHQPKPICSNHKYPEGEGRNPHKSNLCITLFPYLGWNYTRHWMETIKGVNSDFTHLTKSFHVAKAHKLNPVSHFQYLFVLNL